MSETSDPEADGSDAEGGSEYDPETEREAIRRRKRERLRRRIEGEDDVGTDDGEEGGDAGDGTPTDPVPVESREGFADLVSTHDPVLVDFHADWCGPCRQLAPVVDSIAADPGVVVAKVDVDRHQALAAEYDVRGVPTLLLFAGGDPVERVVGVRPESQLRSLVDGYRD